MPHWQVELIDAVSFWSHTGLAVPSTNDVYKSLKHVAFGLPLQVTVRPMLWDHSPVCNIGALWPNGWMAQDTLGMEADLGPGNIVSRGPSLHNGKSHSSTHFSEHVYDGQMVTISATAELLFSDDKCRHPGKKTKLRGQPYYECGRLHPTEPSLNLLLTQPSP